MFRMELDTIDMAFVVRNHRMKTVFRRCNGNETARQSLRKVAMRHPNKECFLAFCKKRTRRILRANSYPAVLFCRTRAHTAAQRIHDELQSITNPQNRGPQGKDRSVNLWTFCVIDTLWPARQNDPVRFA